MPELPEVEHLRRTLARVLPGRRVRGTALLRPDVCEPAGATARDLLLAGVFLEPVRRGKHLALVVEDGRALRVHLGMTGQLVVLLPGRHADKQDHIHATWTLDDGSRLFFRDPRRFGGLAPYPSLEELRRAAWATLGPDAASITPAQLAERLAATTRAIKAALLDQGVLAGVGNIYADESLFRAGIHPRRRADRLRPAEVEALSAAIRATLRLAIAGGGSTLRDYVDADGRPGRHQFAHLVYGRAGEPCHRCGRPLRACRLAQRATVYCGACQSRRASPFPHRPTKRPPVPLSQACMTIAG